MIHNPNDLIVLHVTAQDLDIAIKSMMEQPYKVVAPVIEKFVNQANGGQSAPGTPLPPTGPLGDATALAAEVTSAAVPKISSALAAEAIPEGVSAPSRAASAAAAVAEGA